MANFWFLFLNYFVFVSSFGVLVAADCTSPCSFSYYFFRFLPTSKQQGNVRKFTICYFFSHCTINVLADLDTTSIGKTL
jgi:hypothetical protein